MPRKHRPLASDIAAIVERNIDTLVEMRRQLERRSGWKDRLADTITRFSGSIHFLYFHVLWFSTWIAVNVHLTPLPPFDPFPFGLLTMIVSLEAIFLSTFILITQNRLSRLSDQRANLDLQINLLCEHEITQVLRLVDAIADHLGLHEGEDPEIDELKKNVSPEMVLREMEQRQREWQQL